MLAHHSPGGTVLDRYTVSYAAFVGLYVAGLALWSALTAYVVFRLNPERLAGLRAFATRHAGRLLVALGLWIGMTVAFRAAHLARRVGFPLSFAGSMTVIPGLLFVTLLAILVLLSDSQVVEQADRVLADRYRDLVERLRSLAPMWAAPALPRFITPLVLAGLVLGLVAQTVYGSAYWDFPLVLDPSVHLYLGQHVLDGGVPYRTVYYVHPPLSFTISLIWNAGAALADLPPVQFARALDLVVSAGIVVLSYAMGRQLLGHRVGGLLAASLLLGTEHLQEIMILGPNNRLMSVLLMLAAIWVAQRARWLWAGVLSAVAALTYAPLATVFVAVLLSAGLQRQQPRRKAVAAILAGALVVVGLTAISLLAQGALAAAYRQSVLTVWLQVKEVVFVPGAGRSGGGLAKMAALFGSSFRWLFRGDWELLLLLALGLPVTLVTRGLRGVVRSPATSAGLFTVILSLAVLPFHYDAVVLDTILLVAPLAPFGAVAVMAGINAGIGSREADRPHLRAALGWGACVALIVVGVADSHDHVRFLYSLPEMTLNEQQRLADELDAVLHPDEVVQATGSLWYPTLTHQDNATQFIELDGDALPGIRAAGWTYAGMVAEIERQRPVVLMLWPRESILPIQEITAWLEADYTYVGTISPDGLKHQDIYVRNGHAQVETLLRSWPLEE